MQIKNKWLLSVVVMASVGVNSVEGRVPYAVAKAYLPKLLEAIGIEDKERIQRNAEVKLESENNKKDETNKNEIKEKEEENKIKEHNDEEKTNEIKEGDDDENKNEIIIENEKKTNKKEDVENKNIKEKEDDKPTEKEKAILDMIYTDEGQYRMVDWIENSIFPDVLKVFQSKKVDNNKVNKIPICDKGKYFNTAAGFNVSLYDNCKLGGRLLRSKGFATTLFNDLSVVKKAQNLLLKNVDILPNGTEGGCDEEVITEMNRILKIKKQNIKRILKHTNSETKEEKEFRKTLIEIMREVFSVRAKILHDYQNLKKISDLNIDEKDLYAIIERITNGSIEINDILLANKITRIIYLLNIVDKEEDLVNIINSIFLINHNEDAKVVEYKNIIGEKLYYKEYDCRPMPDSVVNVLEVVQKDKQDFKFKHTRPDCAESLLRHLTTIALRHEDEIKKETINKMEELGKEIVNRLSKPQSGILQFTEHDSWRDLVLRKIIDKYCKKEKVNIESNTENNKRPYEIAATVQNICVLMELIKKEICQENQSDNCKKTVLLNGRRIESFKNEIATDNEVDEINISDAQRLEKAMNAIYEVTGKDKYVTKRFVVAIVKRIDEKYENGWDDYLKPDVDLCFKEWIERSAPFEYDYITIVIDNLFKKRYIIGILDDCHCEIIRVLNDKDK